MANLRNAIKEIRKTRSRTIRNLKQKREMKKVIKKVRDFADKGKKKEAEKAYVLATKKIDKTAKNHVIHKNTASRYKSRLAKRINKIKK